MIAVLRSKTRFGTTSASDLAALSVTGLLTLAAIPAAAHAGPTGARQAELTNLLVQDCGSCHGLTLAGGLGPPLRGPALADKPPEYLAAVILYGRPGTAMPPWRPFLTDAEAAWLAEILLAEHLPAEHLPAELVGGQTP